MADGDSAVVGVQQLCWHTWQPAFHASAASHWNGLNFWTKAFQGRLLPWEQGRPLRYRGLENENHAYVARDRPCIPCKCLVHSSDQVNPQNRGTKVDLRRPLGRRSWAEVELWKFQSCSERCQQLLLFLWCPAWGESSCNNALAASKLIFHAV